MLYQDASVENDVLQEGSCSERAFRPSILLQSCVLCAGPNEKAAMRGGDVVALMIKEAELVDQAAFEDLGAAIRRRIPIRSGFQAT